MAELTIYRGDSKTYALNFTDGTNPIDITGYIIFFTVKNKSDDADNDDSALITKTITVHTDPTEGQTQVVLDSTDTTIAIGKYNYDFQFKTDSGAVSTIEKGTYKILDDITKRTE